MRRPPPTHTYPSGRTDLLVDELELLADGLTLVTSLGLDALPVVNVVDPAAFALVEVGEAGIVRGRLVLFLVLLADLLVPEVH